MKHTLESALQYGWPLAQWSLVATNDYSTFTWNSSDYPKPTLDEITKKIGDLDSLEAMRLLRIRRNILLQETDIKSLPDFPHKDTNERNAWMNYRQELRNLTEFASPKLNEHFQLDLKSIEWPNKPNPQSLGAT